MCLASWEQTHLRYNNDNYLFASITKMSQFDIHHVYIQFDESRDGQFYLLFSITFAFSSPFIIPQAHPNVHEKYIYTQKL